MKFTRENLIQIWGVLNGLSAEKTTAKGAYGIAKNKRIAEVEAKSVEEAQKNQKIPDSVIEFENKRTELCEEHCDKDEDNKPIVIDNPVTKMREYSMRSGAAEFSKALNELREEYKEVLEERDETDAEFRKFLGEEIEIEFHTICIDDMPDGMTAQQLGILGEIIVD